jgi:hypothetical protein
MRFSNHYKNLTPLPPKPVDLYRLPVAEQQAFRVAQKDAMSKRFQEMKIQDDARKLEIAAEKAARKQLEMTCQVCGRGILANTGLIAHHGFQRPGYGWQTASCSGAKELPFEVDRAALGEEITNARAHAAFLRKYLKTLRAEEVPLNIKYTVRNTDPDHRDKWIERTLTGITRANWAAQQIECPEAFVDKTGEWNAKAYRYGPFDYDYLLSCAVNKVKHEIKEMDSYIERQQTRYDGWVQTHIRNNDQWEAIT